LAAIDPQEPLHQVRRNDCSWLETSWLLSGAQCSKEDDGFGQMPWQLTTHGGSSFCMLYANFTATQVTDWADPIPPGTASRDEIH